MNKFSGPKFCPIDGGWSDFETWLPCDKYGLEKGFRFCNNPKPQFDGKNCVGENVKVQICTDNYDEGVLLYKEQLCQRLRDIGIFQSLMFTQPFIIRITSDPILEILKRALVFPSRFLELLFICCCSYSCFISWFKY